MRSGNENSRVNSSIQRDIKKDANMHLRSGKEKLEVVAIRLKPSQKELLTKYFEDQGRSLSNGVRFIIEDFIKKEIEE